MKADNCSFSYQTYSLSDGLITCQEINIHTDKKTQTHSIIKEVTSTGNRSYTLSSSKTNSHVNVLCDKNSLIEYMLDEYFNDLWEICEGNIDATGNRFMDSIVPYTFIEMVLRLNSSIGLSKLKELCFITFDEDENKGVGYECYNGRKDELIFVNDNCVQVNGNSITPKDLSFKFFMELYFDLLALHSYYELCNFR